MTLRIKILVPALLLAALASVLASCITVSSSDDVSISGRAASDLGVDDIGQSAEERNAEAQYLLGLRYYYGEGVSRNDAEAARRFRMAAERGNANAMFRLGLCYAYGHGVRQNMDVAEAWIRKASFFGHSDAKKWLRRNRRDYYYR